MNPFRSIRQAPLSVCLIWAACILLVGVYSDMKDEPGAWEEAQTRWGAAGNRVLYHSSAPGSDFEKIAGFEGPLRVWDGQWWRLLVNNLHHAGLIHLLLNGCAIFYLGRIIERRMSSFLYLLMLAGSVFTIAAVTGLTGDLGVGLSGVAYAQVGLLMVWRDRDESVAEEFTMRMVIYAGIWLLLCQVITYAGIFGIDNTAHYTGLIYGWIWGQVYLEEQQKGVFRFLFGVSHLLLFPAFWFIVHPFWLGSWHYYQSQELDLMRDELKRSLASATGEAPGQIERQIAVLEGLQKTESWQRRKGERLQTAVLREPALELAWVELSVIYENKDDRRLALRTVLEGLKHNRSSEKLLNRAIDLWVADELYTEDSNVPELLGQVFGGESENWNEKLAVRVEHERNRLSWEPLDLETLMGVAPFAYPDPFNRRSHQLNELLDRIELVPAPEPQVPEFDPGRRDSALEDIEM